MEALATNEKGTVRSLKLAGYKQADTVSLFLPRTPKLIFEAGDGITVAVPFSQLIRMEAKGSYTEIHFKDRKRHLASKTLGHFDRILTSRGFPVCRVHRSHLINMDHLSAYMRDAGGWHVQLSNLKTVPISRTQMGNFMLAVERFHVRV